MKNHRGVLPAMVFFVAGPPQGSEPLANPSGIQAARWSASRRR